MIEWFAKDMVRQTWKTGSSDCFPKGTRITVTAGITMKKSWVL